MVAKKADGVIVGSAIVKTIEINADSPVVVSKLREFVTPLIEATHRAYINLRFLTVQPIDLP